MKILCYRNTYDHNFESMISILSKTKYKVGYLHGQIDEKSFSEFSPDIILHNLENVTSFPMKTKAISININETESDRSFSTKNSLAKNYIKPFVVFKETEVEEKHVNKFKSDVIYIGSPFVFKREIVGFLSSSYEIKFKFFDDKPAILSGYCGVCEPKDYFKFYKFSKASLVAVGDNKRLMDIVVADGNPVLIDSDIDGSIDRIKDAVLHGKKYKIPNFSKENILENETVYDRVAEIFSKVGLAQIAKEVKTIKKNWNNI